MTALAAARTSGPFGAPALKAHVARIALPWPSEAALVSGASLGIYLALAALLVFAMHSVVGDAWSRVGNAYYVLYSRDPHLAAIGFVWNPLPSVAIAPLLPLKAIWPALVDHGFAANIVSAVCMGGAVYQLRATLREVGVPRAGGLALTALFALHPMVLFYAANGMSEGMFLLFCLTAIRHLVRWTATRQSASLVHCGIALALLYLTRYEGAAVAAGAIVFVLCVSFRRAAGGLRQRGGGALADALIVTTPFAFAFGLFALVSWIIVGSPFETFSSVYGNTSQVGLAAGSIADMTGQGTPAAPGYVVGQIAGLEPAVAIVGAAALFALARRRPELLVPMALLGACLVFSIWTFMSGNSFGWLRFYIVVIPLVTLAAGALMARVGQGALRASAWRRWSYVLVTAVALGLVALGLPSGLAAMDDPRLGREETDTVRWLVGSTQPWSGGTLFRQQQQYAALDLARYLDRQGLAPGSVLVDVATGFPVVLQSERPAQFVITPDRDFQAAVADPRSFGVRFIIVAPDVGYEMVNAIERAHPGMYDTGAGIATAVSDFGSGNASWRLYRVNGASP